MSGEGWRIVRDAGTHSATVVRRVVNAVGDAHAAGIGAEVVIVHQNRRAIPFGSASSNSCLLRSPLLEYGYED
jgi:hypothetical protein